MAENWWESAPVVRTGTGSPGADNWWDAAPLADAVPTPAAPELGRRSVGEWLSDTGSRIAQTARDVTGGIVGLPTNLANLQTSNARQMVQNTNQLRQAIGLPALDNVLTRAVGVQQQPAAVQGIRESLAIDNAASVSGMTPQARELMAGADERDGFFDTLGYYARRPAFAAQEVIAQAPQLLQVVPGSLPATVAAQMGGIGSQAEQQVVREAEQRGQGQQEAAERGATAFATTAPIGALSAVIPGGLAVERLVTGAAGRPVSSRLAAGLTALGGETATETVQEGLEQVAQNYALGDPLGEGVPAAMAQGAILGAGMGAPAAVGTAAMARPAQPSRGDEWWADAPTVEPAPTAPQPVTRPAPAVPESVAPAAAPPVADVPAPPAPAVAEAQPDAQAPGDAAAPDVTTAEPSPAPVPEFANYTPGENVIVERTSGPDTFRENRLTRAIVDKHVKTGDTAALLDDLAQQPDISDAERWLAGRLAPIMRSLDIRLTEPRENLRAGGAWDNSTRTLSVKQAVPETVLHEPLHAATSALIDSRSAQNIPEVRQFVGELNTLAQHLQGELLNFDTRRLPEAVQRTIANPTGPLANPKELIAYAFTNRGFQDFLRQLPPPPGWRSARNAWDAFKQAVHRLFGATTPQQATLLDAILESGGGLVDFAAANPRAVEMVQRLQQGTFGAEVAPTPLQAAGQPARPQDAQPEPAGPEATPEAAAPPAAAPAAVEAAARPSRSTSTKNAVRDAEREAEGRDPIIRAAAKANPQTIAEAQEAMSENPSLADETVERLISDPAPTISLMDEAVLLIEKVRLRNAREDAAGRAGNDRLTPEQRAVAQREWAAAEAAIDRIDQATSASGREWGRFGQLRQRMMREDYTLEAMERRARAVIGGPLSPELQQRIKQQARQIEALQKQLAEAQERAADVETTRLVSETLDRTIREVKSATRQAAKAGKPRTDVLKERADAARERLKKLTAEDAVEVGEIDQAGNFDQAGRGMVRADWQAAARELGLPATGSTDAIAGRVRIARAHPRTWSRQDFDTILPYLSVHQDLRGGNADSILRDGMTTGMTDSASRLEPGSQGWSWARGYAGGDVYVFLPNAPRAGRDNPRLARGARPLFLARPEKGGSLFDSLQDAIVPENGRDPGTFDQRAPAIDQTTTPEFKRWFGDSKVVDAQGKPLVVYHGTNESFDTFTAGEFGFHFGDTDAAAMMGEAMPVYLAIANPLRMPDLGVWTPRRVLGVAHVRARLPTSEVAAAGNAADRLEKRLRSRLDNDDDIIEQRRAHYEWSTPARDLLARHGIDGIVYKNEAEGFGDSYIAFRPEQIKSATGNRGTFDPADPRIDYAALTDPDSIADAVDLGTWHIAQGVSDLADFTAKMEADLGAAVESLRSRMAEIYARSQQQNAVSEQSYKAGVRTVAQVSAEINPEAVSRADVVALAKAHIAAGMTGERVMAAVHADLEKLGATLTERDVRQLFAEHGRAENPTRNDAKRSLRELRSLVRMQESIDRLAEGRDRLKDTRKREQASEAIRIKREQLDAALRQAQSRQPMTAERAEALRNARIRNLQARIADLQDMIATGRRPQRRGRSTTTDADILALEQQRDTLIRQLREMDRPPRDPEAIYQRTRATSMRNQIQQLERRLREGDFSKPVRIPRALNEENERLAFELDRVKARYNEQVFLEGLKNRTPGQRAFDEAASVIGFSRAVLTGPDVSGVGRQGGFLTLGDPMLMAKGLAGTFSAFRSEQRQHAAMERIRNSPNARLYKLMGLDFTSNEGKLSGYEEAYQTRLLNYLDAVEGQPARNKARTVLNVATAPWRASNRAYTTGLNVVRAAAADTLLDSFTDGGPLTTDELVALGRFINTATGRPSFGKWDNGTVFMNMVFFAPRWVASRFNLLLKYPAQMLVGGQGMTPRVKMAIAKRYARYAAGLAVLDSLAFLGMIGMGLGDDDDDRPFMETDPRSSAFMMPRFGDTYLDTTSGLTSAARFIAQVATGERKTASGEIVPLRDGMTLTNGLYQIGQALRAAGLDDLAERFPDKKSRDRRFKESGVAEVGGNFLWSKLAPLPGAVWNSIVGENVIGQKTTPANEALSMFYPMMFEESKEMVGEHGAMGAPFIASAALGWSPQLRDPSSFAAPDYKVLTHDERKQYNEFLRNTTKIRQDLQELRDLANTFPKDTHPADVRDSVEARAQQLGLDGVSVARYVMNTTARDDLGISKGGRLKRSASGNVQLQYQGWSKAKIVNTASNSVSSINKQIEDLYQRPMPYSELAEIAGPDYDTSGFGTGESSLEDRMKVARSLAKRRGEIMRNALEELR